jgi:predicted transcriptional regulator
MQDLNPELFTNSKWLLIKEISGQHQSPTELAEKTNTSLSNVIQQLKLLEAYNIVRKEKSLERNTGKPRTIYSINDEFVYGIMLRDGKCEKRYFKIDEMNATLANIIFTLNPDDIFYMMKFSFKYEDILKKCKAIGFIKSTKDSMELFLITDHVDEIRSKFSNIFIEDGHGKTKKIINWTHNEYEINDGLQRKDKYFMDMLKNAQLLHDSDSILQKFKQKRDLM